MRETSSSTRKARRSAGGAAARRRGGRRPCVVMSHGFSAIKEMHLDDYAEVSATPASRAWCSTTAASARRTPRPASRGWSSTRGSRSATTSTRSPTPSCGRRSTRSRSACGARATPPPHSYVVAAIDRRVKAVCGQVPLVSGRRAFEMLVRIDFWEPTWQLLAADRQARARGEAPAMLPVVDADPTAQSALPPRTRSRSSTTTREARGGTRSRCAASSSSGLRAGRVPQANLADAAADGGRAERPPGRG